MHKKSWILFGLALLSGLNTGLARAAVAVDAGALRPRPELSMLITGSVDIERDGTVSAWRIDRADVLPKAVVGLVEKSARGWRFDPVLVQGQPVKARTAMNLRIVAKELKGGRYAVDIRSAYFGGNGKPEESVSLKKMTPPDYPLNAEKSGISGTVYLVLKIGRDGAVEEAVAEQTNLRGIIASESQTQRARALLERPALRAARAWRFAPPTAGDNVDDAWWSVRVPVEFTFEGSARAYGQWEIYVPGPRQPLPWQSRDVADNAGADAYSDGTMTMGGQALRLLTPLTQG